MSVYFKKVHVERFSHWSKRIDDHREFSRTHLNKIKAKWHFLSIESVRVHGMMMKIREDCIICSGCLYDVHVLSRTLCYS